MATRTGSELRGLAVMTLAGGERLGRIHDTIFHAASGRVTGFLVDSNGVFSKPRFLPSGQVQSLGGDALTITTADALSKDNPASVDTDELEAHALDGRPVMSASGTVLGKIADVNIDTDSLTVPSFLLSVGLLSNTIHGKPRLPLALVKTVGRDSIVVPDTYDPGAAEYHGAAS